MNTSVKRITVNIVSLVTVFLMLAAAAIIRDSSILGHKVESSDETTPGQQAETFNPDGTVTINTTSLTDKIIGYAGPVPVEITIADDKITSITPLDNNETPGFFKRVTSSDILESWIGKSPEQALATEVDAVTGATYSSKALITNVQYGLQYYLNNDIKAKAPAQAAPRDIKFYCILAVVILAGIVPLFTKNKRYRTLQQILNTAILGFWGGTFIDYTMMLSIMSNGITAAASVTTLLLLFIAFIYPLFGKSGYYCAWVCPLGSIQELAGKCNPNHKIHLSPRMISALNRFRYFLWSLLMLMLWTGLFMSWIDYELFTAFMVREAALGVVIAGACFVLLSLFITRPYCRFVCPTGTILRISQNTDNN